MSNKKRKKINPLDKQEIEETEEKKPGFNVFLGVVLLAGALFNVPAIMKVPETTADKMMLVIVIVMLIGGVILLTAGRKK